jgi:putative flippase GtrA
MVSLRRNFLGERLLDVRINIGGLAEEARRFLISGLAKTAITFAVYWSLLPFSNYRYAYVAAFVAGLVFLTTVNARYVFQVQLSVRTAIAFTTYQLFYFATFGVVLALVVELFHVAPAIAPLLVLVITTPANFVVTRLLFHCSDTRPLTHN